MSSVAETHYLPSNHQVHHLIIETPTKNKMSHTLKKVLNVVACILIILGVSLMMGGSLFFGFGAAGGFFAAGISTAMLAAAPTMIPLGLTSLLSGCHMLYISEKGSFNSKTLDISDLSIK